MNASGSWGRLDKNAAFAWLLQIPANNKNAARQKTQARGPLMLADDEFWGDCSRTEPEILPRLLREKFQGLLIDAPRIVRVDQRDSAPVAGYFVRSLRNDLTIDQEEQMLVASIDLETNVLSVGLALKSGKIRAPGPPAPTSDPGEGTTANLFKTELRRALNLPWQPGRYRVAVLLREFLSNPVTIEFTGSDASGLRTRSVRGQAETPPKIYPEPAAGQAGLSLPDYRRRDTSPAVPTQPGIEFNVKSEVSVAPGAICPLHGSFRLPVIKTGDSAGNSGASKDRRPSAIVAITIVVTGDDAVGPWVIRLKVPTYDPIKPGARTMVTGFFNLDLFRVTEFPRRPMTCYLTAFGGEFISGPKTVKLIP